ncbi:MAG: hypothetical protein V3V16_14150, partial [Melioribacteraceae bacterium]
MSLTTKQKNWITKHNKSKSIKTLATDLDVNEKQVEKYLRSNKLTKQPNKIFYLVLILIPILFFLLLEFSLNIFNYGTDIPTWVKVTDTHYGLN